MQRIPLFTLFGITLTISPLGIASFLVAIPVLGWLAARVMALSFGQALLAGALSAAAMFVSEWVHQMAHARAAWRAGYPMVGIHWHSLFAACLYPPDEPPLPRSIHVQRALGGFWVNVLIGLLLAPLAFFLWLQGGVGGFVVAFTAIYNFFVLGLGALVPIDFPGFTNDGGTLLRLWRERSVSTDAARNGSTDA